MSARRRMYFSAIRRSDSTGFDTYSRFTEPFLNGLGAQPAFADAILGDLAEERARIEQQRGAFAAQWWYVREALRAAPHLAWNAVRHGGLEGRVRVAAVLCAVALVPTVAVLMRLAALGAPTRIVVDLPANSTKEGGIILNNTHPVQLSMHAYDRRGHALPSTSVRYRLLSGEPVLASKTGVVNCAQGGDAIVGASIGSLRTTVRVHCRPIRELRADMYRQLVVGEPAQSLTLIGVAPDGSREPELAGDLEVADTSIATLRGVSLTPRAPGQTSVTMHIGDAEVATSITVYEPVRSLYRLRADQRYVAAPVRLVRGQTIVWTLPKGLFWVQYRPSVPGQPIPGFRAQGAVMCMPDFGPSVRNFSCLARDSLASIQITHPGAGAPGNIAGRITVNRQVDQQSDQIPRP